ncbi:MAG TPA: RpiB/LacA/LacB family sugar-phosphate isomerase [Patescibacteria group bacterium]|nr:RpiB/LacA/LacB family sugar-phosphate isomerase [Patescibacteria group bacterium]
MIWLASDHAGVELKDMVKAELGRLSKKYEDLGANSHEPTDYPPLAHQVARKVSTEPNDRGILICKSGQGMAMAANRHKGVRASVVWNKEIAHETREDNNSNILALPAGYIDGTEAVEMVREWLKTPFSDAERHVRRTQQIDES